MDDEISKNIVGLSGDLPQGRRGLSESQKDELVQIAGGAISVRNIQKSQKDLPEARIIFVFNSIDSQAVADILVNDMSAAIQRAIALKK
jgi:hypothetical protein